MTVLLCRKICQIFCWDGKNGILLPKLFWPTVRKNCFSDREKLLNSRLKAKNLQYFWDHYYNLFKLWKIRTIFGNRMVKGEILHKDGKQIIQVYTHLQMECLPLMGSWTDKYLSHFRTAKYISVKAKSSEILALSVATILFFV